MKNSINDDYIKDIEEKLSKKLDKKRYIHTISVAYTAANLAMAHGIDVYRAYLAGLLHDNAKCIPNDKKIALCAKYGLTVSSAEKASPELLHAKLGSYLAKVKYNVSDEEILSAIEYHTTGKPNMTLLEKIIYIADYMEPHRKMLKDMDRIRKLAFSDIDEALRIILKNCINYLEEKDATMDELTLQTYEYYNI